MKFKDLWSLDFIRVIWSFSSSPEKESFRMCVRNLYTHISSLFIICFYWCFEVIQPPVIHNTRPGIVVTEPRRMAARVGQEGVPHMVYIDL